MDNQTPTDLFKQHHHFKTELMIDTIAQVYLGLKQKGIDFSEESVISIAAEVWSDSLNLIQDNVKQETIFIVEDGDDFEIV